MERFRKWAKSWYYGLSGEELRDDEIDKKRKIKEFEDRYYIAMAKIYGMI